jgi:hypothetical protein
MKNVALVHNYPGHTKVHSDVRIAVEALKGKDPMAAVLKIYMDTNPEEFMRALPRSGRPEEMASFEGIQAINSLAADIRSHIAPEEHIAESVAAYNSYWTMKGEPPQKEMTEEFTTIDLHFVTNVDTEYPYLVLTGKHEKVLLLTPTQRKAYLELPTDLRLPVSVYEHTSTVGAHWLPLSPVSHKSNKKKCPHTRQMDNHFYLSYSYGASLSHPTPSPIRAKKSLSPHCSWLMSTKTGTCHTAPPLNAMNAMQSKRRRKQGIPHFTLLGRTARDPTKPPPPQNYKSTQI